MGRPHVVPLSEPALRLLGEMQRYRDPASDFVFPGAQRRHRAQRRHAAPHARRRWVTAARSRRTACAPVSGRGRSETTNYEKDVIEGCLAHAKGELDSAYHRGAFSTSAGA